MPGSKLYIINSTALIPVVQRQHRTIAFGPIAAKAARDVMGCSATSDKIVSLEPTKDEGYLMTFAKAMHQVMAPSARLDAMNRVSVQRIAELLDGLEQQTTTAVHTAPGVKTKLRLFEWTRHSILRATTDAVYGPRNPFRDPDMQQAWYRFERGLIFLMAGGLASSLLARDALRARRELVSHFGRYFAASSADDASELIRARLAHSRSFSIPYSEMPCFELGNAFAILANTLPAAFWILFHVYSDARVLAEMREELERIVTSSSSPSGGTDKITLHTIDADAIKTSCPLLLSAFREVLRYHGTGASARLVLEDRLLDGKYLLKKGNTVLIPVGVQHTDPGAWGPDVHLFNHRRFVKDARAKTKDARERAQHLGAHPAGGVAFRGFGGGTVLCPGRHFASTEILVFAALMILRFDMRPVGGAWPTEPTVRNSTMAGTIPSPDTDVEVEVELRGSAAGLWRVGLSGGLERAMELAAEDMGGGGGGGDGGA